MSAEAGWIGGDMATAVGRVQTTHVGASASARCGSRPSRRGFRRAAKGSRCRGRSQAGRGGDRHRQRRRVRKVDLAVVHHRALVGDRTQRAHRPAATRSRLGRVRRLLRLRAEHPDVLFYGSDRAFWQSIATRPVCVGPIAYQPGPVQRDIANLKAALEDVEVADAFMPVVAPASIEVDMGNDTMPAPRSCSSRSLPR